MALAGAAAAAAIPAAAIVVAVAAVAAVGPAGDGLLAAPDRVTPQVPTFTRDVAPIVFEHCAPCHRPGEAAPFPLLDHDDVARRAGQIAEVTSSGYMPPWLPRPGAHAIVGERRLTPAEVATLARWAAAGAPRGDPADLPPPPRFSGGWRLGRPDLVLTLPEPYRLAAGGEDLFRNFVFPTRLERPRWVRALEFRPGNRLAVHHATIAVDPGPASRHYDASDPEPGFDGMINTETRRPDGHLLGWVPGKAPYEVDESIAWRLEPGADLVAQLHLQRSGKPEEVAPSIGLFFSDRPATRTPFLLRLGSLTVDIPPGEPAWPVADSYELPVDVQVLGVIPHAHYLGRSMSFEAELPDGTRETLLSIPEWNFDWQDEYRYADPPTLPAGTTLAMRFTYDNTADNPRNPHLPPQRVVYGPRTDDEMADLWIQVLARDETGRRRLAADFARKEAAARIAGFGRLLQADPDDAATRVALGQELEATGRTGAAMAEFRRALEDDPGHPMAHTRLGLWAHRRGRAAEAAGHYRAVLARRADLPEIHYDLARALEQQDDAAGAESHYREALALRPELVEARTGLGGLLAGRGRMDEALAELREAVRLRPDSARAHNNLGSALAASGRMDEAIVCFERALRLDPGHAQARRNLERARAR